METDSTYSLLLTTWHEGRFQNLVGYSRDTPLYLTRIPSTFSLETTLPFLMKGNDTEGLLQYEAKQFFVEMKELIIESLHQGESSIVVLGPKHMLGLLKKELDFPLPIPLRYSFYDPHENRKSPTNDIFFVVEGGELKYYSYPESLSYFTRENIPLSAKPRLN